MVTANSRKIRPDQPGHHHQRQEDRRQRDGHREDGEADLPRAVERGLERPLAALHPPHRVLQEHDGVVDEEPDGQRQGHQRQIVEAVVEHPHDDERHEQGERQRDRRDQRVGRAAQEDEDDDDDQHEGDDERELDVVDAVHDRLRPVVDGRDPHRARKLGHDDRDLIPDALGHLHRVRPCLTEDGEHHRGGGNRVAPGPEAHVDPLVLDGFPDVGDVAQVHRRAVARAHDQVLVRVDAVELAVGPEQRGPRRRIELAGARIAGAAADGARQIVDGDPARPHGPRVRLDADRRLRAEDRHPAHARAGCSGAGRSGCSRSRRAGQP